MIKCRGKMWVLFYINCCPAYFSAINLYLELKMKRCFLKIIKKHDSTMIFRSIFINRIQHFEAAIISAAFFLCRQMTKHINFWENVQDDILCALAMYSYMWDWLYLLVKTPNLCFTDQTQFWKISNKQTFLFHTSIVQFVFKLFVNI